MIRNKQDDIFSRLIDMIEMIRISRMRRFKSGHKHEKRFTQQELNDVACSTYKNYLDGRSRRIPSPDELNRIADYLECSLEERHHLFAIAQYVSQALTYHDPGQLEKVLANARKIMRDLQFPSMLVTRDYQMHTICPNMTAVAGVPPLGEIALQERTLLHLAFNPQFAPYLTAETREWIQATSVYHFKYGNESFQHLDWYQRLFASMRQQPAFRQRWHITNINSLTRTAMYKIAVSLQHPAQTETLKFNLVRMLVDSQMKTYILLLLPADEQSRELVNTITCHQASPHQPDWQTCNQWERA